MIKSDKTDQGAVVDLPTTELAKFENTLRPDSLEQYIGQSAIKNNLKIAIRAAKKRSEPLDHILLHGAAGLGKTTLAFIIAREFNVNLKLTSGPALEKQGDIASIISNLQENDVLFIDEIHRLKPVVEEVLYTAMEDFGIDLVIGKGPSARTMRINLPKFTLIGATTRLSEISAPLRSRFGNVFKLDFYKQVEITEIIVRSSKILNCKIEKDLAEILAQSSRQIPRIANRLLKRVRDFADVENDSIITPAVLKKALNAIGIDELGMDQMDREILALIIEKFDGGPVGLSTLSAAICEDESTIEDVYEPFLIQLGFLQRTSRGRIVTPGAYDYLGYEIGRP